MGGLELAGEDDDGLKCMRLGEAKYDDTLGNALCAPCLHARAWRGGHNFVSRMDVLDMWQDFMRGKCVQETIDVMVATATG
jgi:hypothetical protein